MFVNLVQEELRDAVVHPVFLDTHAGYIDTILELRGEGGFWKKSNRHLETGAV